jgi:hypothetical protein
MMRAVDEAERAFGSGASFGGEGGGFYFFILFFYFILFFFFFGERAGRIGIGAAVDEEERGGIMDHGCDGESCDERTRII